MSVSCQKRFQIVVGAPPNAYWKLDETGSVNRVDSIHGIIATVFFGTVDSVAGKINNGAHFPLNGVENELFATASPFLAFSSVGFVYTFWVKVLTYGAAFLSVDFAVGGTSDVNFRYTGSVLDMVVQPDNNPDIHTNLGSQPAGVWQFFTVVYDASIPAFKVTINRGAVTQVNLLAPIDPYATGGWSVASVDGQSEFIFDEMGVWMNTVLSDSFLDFLYNAGSGQRPPGV
jgi:hypothetical protein